MSVEHKKTITFEALNGLNIPGVLQMVASGLLTFDEIEVTADWYREANTENPSKELAYKASLLETIWLLCQEFENLLAVPGNLFKSTVFKNLVPYLTLEPNPSE